LRAEMKRKAEAAEREAEAARVAKLEAEVARLEAEVAERKAQTAESAEEDVWAFPFKPEKWERDDAGSAWRPKLKQVAKR
jgi:hypothetical protein